MPQPTIQLDSENTENQEARVRCAASGAAIETTVRKPRRRFCADERQRILEETEQASASGRRGAIGEVMRKNGVYSCQLSAWRSQLVADPETGLEPRKPGRKAKSGKKSMDMPAALRRIAALEKELRVANAGLELKKKQNLPRVAFPQLIGDGETMQ